MMKLKLDMFPKYTNALTPSPTPGQDAGATLALV